MYGVIWTQVVQKEKSQNILSVGVRTIRSEFEPYAVGVRLEPSEDEVFGKVLRFDSKLLMRLELRFDSKEIQFDVKDAIQT